MFFFSPKISLLVVVALKDYDELEYREIIRACKEAKIKPVIAGPSRAACFGIAKEKLTPQVSIEEVNMKDYAGIVFVGGLGVRDYFNHLTCQKLVKEAVKLNKVIGAIDYGAMILAHSEILKGKKGTVHPTEESHFIAAGMIYQNEPIVIDGLLITAQDRKQAAEFADLVAGASVLSLQ